MGGAQPLAVTMNGGVCLAVEVDEARAQRRVATRYCDRAHALARRRAGAVPRGGGRTPPARASRWSATPPRCTRSSCARGLTPDVVDRPDLGARSAQRLRAGGAEPRAGGGAARARTRPSTCGARGTRWRRRCARMLAMKVARRGAVRLRQQPARRGGAGRTRARARVLVSGFRAGVHPPAVLPRQGAVPLGGALGRSGGHRSPPIARRSRSSPTTRGSIAGSRWPQKHVALPGPAGAHLLARLRRARATRAALQSHGARGPS